MLRKSFIAYLLFHSTAALANDWEKSYQSWVKAEQYLPAGTEPEASQLPQNIEGLAESMWRKGYAAIGMSSFQSRNGKTADAVKFAKLLKAKFVFIATNLDSSRTASIPLTVPNTTTSYTTGSASAYGSGGYAHGTYSGTTTTYGSSTSYIPITINSYTKAAVYFAEVPKGGLGVFLRELTPSEIGLIQTRRALAVRWVRDNSPAYISDILPGDIITKVEGVPAASVEIRDIVAKGQPFKIELFRNGQYRDLTVSIPHDWIGAQ